MRDVIYNNIQKPVLYSPIYQDYDLYKFTNCNKTMFRKQLFLTLFRVPECSGTLLVGIKLM